VKRAEPSPRASRGPDGPAERGGGRADPADAARVVVRLTPRAGRDGIDGIADGLLLARVRAAPVAGAANEALRHLIADELGVSVSRVRLVAGGRGRRKVLEIEGLARARIAARWPGLAGLDG